MKIPVKSLRSFEVCSSECALYETCSTPGSLEIADIGYAVGKITRDAARMSNLTLSVNPPEFVERMMQVCEIEESLEQSVWACARSRALGTCAGIDTIHTELL